MKRLIPIGLILLALAGCSSSAPTVQSLIPPTSTPSSSLVKGWITKWCSAVPGMSKDQLVGIMGKPTEPGNGQSDRWQGYGWQFNAFYGTDGYVSQLDVNEYGLTAAESASLGCGTIRTAS